MTITELRRRIADVAYKEARDVYAAALAAYARIPFDALIREDPTALRLDRMRTAGMLSAGDAMIRARTRLLSLSAARPDTFRRAARQL